MNVPKPRPPRPHSSRLSSASARRQRDAKPARLGPELFQAHTAGGELMAVGRLNVPLPEMLSKAQPHGHFEDDVGIGSRFAGRIDALVDFDHATFGARDDALIFLLQ